MFHKIMYLLAVLVCLALVIPEFNCATGPSSTIKKLELKLEKAPRLNEPVKLTCIRQTRDFVTPGQEKKVSDNTIYEKTASDNVSQEKSKFIPPGQEQELYNKSMHEKITLEFERVDLKTYNRTKVPAAEVLVAGNLNWEGDMTGEPMEFSAILKFPYEGNWAIFAHSTTRWVDGDAIFLNITEDSSSFGWPEDYRPHTNPGTYSPTQYSPITVELDIPKPPRLNEPVQLTWSLNSIRDVDGVIGQVLFGRLEGTTGATVPAEDVLIEGDLAWNGSLKKDKPIYFSATVKFPLEGDWEVRAYGDSYAEQMPINSTYRLFLHIDKNKSRWGWTESHEIKTHGPPPPPIPVPEGR